MSSIAPFDLPGTFFRGNLHTHSTLSDGRLPVSEVVDAYQRKGYDFLMMSEHFVDLFDFARAIVVQGTVANRGPVHLGPGKHCSHNR